MMLPLVALGIGGFLVYFQGRRLEDVIGRHEYRALCRRLRYVGGRKCRSARRRIRNANVFLANLVRRPVGWEHARRVGRPVSLLIEYAVTGAWLTDDGTWVLPPLEG